MTSNEWPIFDLYFATIVGMSLHPGYLKMENGPMTLAECADLAESMIRVRRHKALGISQEDIENEQV